MLAIASMVGVKAHGGESIGHRVRLQFGHGGEVVDDFVGGLDFHTGTGGLGRVETKQIVREHPKPSGLRCVLFSFLRHGVLLLEGLYCW